MFRVSYINANNEIMHKCGFNGIKAANDWVKNNPDIVALKLLVWNDDINSYMPIYEY